VRSYTSVVALSTVRKNIIVISTLRGAESCPKFRQR
jgi:hypothetical protein